MLPTIRSPYAHGAQEAFALPRNPLASHGGTWLLWYCGLCYDFVTITAADKDAMQPREPAFENLLRTANLHEDVISALRKEEILDRDIFVALDSTEEGLAASAKDAFGVDPNNSFPHKMELAKLERAGNNRTLEEATLREPATVEVEGRGTIGEEETVSGVQLDKGTKLRPRKYLSACSGNA